MSKIKLLVEIDEEDYSDFCDWFESVPSSVDGLPCVKGKFNTALYDAKPYNPTGDLISREALKEYVKKVEDYDSADTICAYIDNAPTVERPQGDYETECNVLLSLEQIVRRSEGWEDDAIEAVHNAVQTAIKCMKGGAEE